MTTTPLPLVPQAVSEGRVDDQPRGRVQAEVGGSMALDASLIAADLVICQTGCISHDEYWRVQDHCRRTGKPCILVDQPLAVRDAQARAALRPMVVLRMASVALPAAFGQPAD